MTELDLKALAAAKGYGVAQKALQEAGHWDEHAGSPEKVWRVVMQASMPVTATVYIRARSADEATEKAEVEGAKTTFDWDYEDGAEDFIFLSVQEDSR